LPSRETVYEYATELEVGGGREGEVGEGKWHTRDEIKEEKAIAPILTVTQ
jgi:hypothetical protein